VISRGTKEFWALYHALSSESRAQARKAFLLFVENPTILRFKKLQGTYPYCSVRFGTGYGAVCRRASDKADWIWIGTHQDFDKTF
jgi:hypothetical protein